jgi:hypothetical protein
MAVATSGPAKPDIVLYAIASSVFIIVGAYLLARHMSKKLNKRKIKELREKENQ